MTNNELQIEQRMIEEITESELLLQAFLEQLKAHYQFEQ